MENGKKEYEFPPKENSKEEIVFKEDFKSYLNEKFKEASISKSPNKDAPFQIIQPDWNLTDFIAFLEEKRNKLAEDDPYRASLESEIEYFKSCIKEESEPKVPNAQIEKKEKCMDRLLYPTTITDETFPNPIISKLKELGHDFENEPPEQRLGELLGFCSCIDEDILKKMWEIFLLLLTKNNCLRDIKEKTGYDPNFIQVTISVFDAVGLMEHGSGVRCCWLAVPIEDAEAFFGVKLKISYFDGE